VTWAADGTPDPLAAEAAAALVAREVLGEREALTLLAAAGVPVTPWVAVPADPDAAVAAWRELGCVPVALKHDAAGIAHKSEAGGVALDLGDEAAVRAAVGALREAARGSGVELRGLLVEPMSAPGVELIVGGRRDPVVGPVVLVGLGGIFAEVLDDVAVLLAPATAATVRRHLERLRGASILRGARGRPAVDIDAVARLVSGLATVMERDPSLLEVDLNPVIAGPNGSVAVDALVVRAVAGA
jgi:hypothetical protein